MTFTTLVLSGGGVRGIALLGALSQLRKAGQLDGIKTVVGISAGSFAAATMAMGIDEHVVFETLAEMDVAGLRRASVLNLMSRFGLDTGAQMIKFIQKFFVSNGFSANITFAQLHKITGVTLRIGASNVNDGSLYFFSHETEPDCAIVQALRMSCGIPFIFTTWKYNGQYYIDGAIKDNFPIERFTEKDNEDPHVLGIILRETVPITPMPPNVDFFDYADRICTMMASSIDEKTMNNVPSTCRVMEIRCERISLLYSITQKTKNILYEIGTESAIKFLQSGV